MQSPRITCPTCDSELRPPVSGDCPICLTPLPPSVRQAMAAQAEAEARAAAAAAAQAAVAAQAAATAQAAPRLVPGMPPPPNPPSAPLAGGPASIFHSSPWAAGPASTAPTVPLLVPPPPPTSPPSVAFPQYAQTGNTVPNYPPPVPPMGYRVGNVGNMATMGTSGLATTSMILALVNLCLGGVLLGIPAVICGHMALNRIKLSNGMLGGRGMAITGLILGYLEILYSFIILMTYLSAPH